MIWRQRHCSQENGDNSEKKKKKEKNRALWFEKIMREMVQRRSRAEFKVDPISNPSISAFYRQFCETGCV
jgi:hypothetical protein